MSDCSISIPSVVMEKITKESELQGVSVYDLATEALNLYLEELEQDRKDFEEAKKLMTDLKNGKEELLSAEQVYEELGI